MSILGLIVRARPADLPDIRRRLAALAQVDVADSPDEDNADGRLVLVIEDSAERSAAATMADIAVWPQVLNTSLVYEYSGPDSPAPGEAPNDYNAWRSSLRPLSAT
jgi:periplasmic nitrate reductase NapD